MSKYYKNFIMCGELDYFCLLCQEAFGAEADVEKHLRWDKHRKDLKVQEYMPKYKKDCIYKVNDFYYCEVCNLTISNVTDHTKDDYHKTRMINPDKALKKSPSLNREPNGMVKVKDKILTMLQWHGIKDGKCILCSVNVKRSHTTSSDHMLNLIQTTVKFENNNCYRQLKSNKFCCFTCFETFDDKDLANHWIDNHNNDSKCEENPIKKIVDHTGKSNSDVNNNVDDIMIKIYAQTMSKYYKIDMQKKTALCLECNTSVNVNSKDFFKHLNEYHPYTLAKTGYVQHVDHGKQRSELAKYGKENYIKLNEGGSKGFCSLCNIYVSAHINCAKQHVHGVLHKGHLEIKGLIKDRKHEKPPSKMVSYKSFVKTMYGPFHIAEYVVVVFNEGVCVELMSLAMIGVTGDFKGNTRKCFTCDVILHFDDIQIHYEKEEHRNMMYRCKVVPLIVEGDNEFIRQIPSGLYHCGLCNKVYPFWETMSKHLNSFKHKIHKTKHKIFSTISSKLFLNPRQDVKDMKEYVNLRKLDGWA